MKMEEGTSVGMNTVSQKAGCKRQTVFVTVVCIVLVSTCVLQAALSWRLTLRLFPTHSVALSSTIGIIVGMARLTIMPFVRGCVSPVLCST